MLARITAGESWMSSASAWTFADQASARIPRWSISIRPAMPRKKGSAQKRLVYTRERSGSETVTMVPSRRRAATA